MLFVSVAASSPAFAQSVIKRPVSKKMATKLAKGTFEVKLEPQPTLVGGDEAIGRLAMTKSFAGDLVGVSTGQMLGFQSTAVKGSGGYVAMETVTGTLSGRKGSFILQHIGTMQAGSYELNVSVVPDSGTGELVGIVGKFNIIIEGGKHFYELEYSLPEQKK